jgi:L-ascorbate metabolism protein UlaG (beta-lactamase superfamily)
MLINLSFRIILISCLAAVVACNPARHLSYEQHQAFDERASAKALRISFNGVASFYLQYDSVAVLTDPFFSNPGMAKVTMGKLKTNAVHLSKLPPKFYGLNMIVVGHAHYDHIMDLPWFLERCQPQPMVVGPANGIQMALAHQEDLSVTDAGALKATDQVPGQWIFNADRSLRIMAAKSDHLPHIGQKHLYKGKLAPGSLTAFPFKAKQFLQDETLTYLIDFLGHDGQVIKRVYFSSSASSGLNGFFPKDVLAEKAVDVAILSLAMAQKADPYPSELLDLLQPSEVVFCHWENFFRPANKKLKWVGATSFKYVSAQIETARKRYKVRFIKPGNSWVL